jgi:hypothetical protein
LLTGRSPLHRHYLEGEKDADGAIVEPGYQQALESRGNTQLHVSTTINRVKRILDGWGLIFWKDLNAPGAATRIEVFLGKLRSDKEITGDRTGEPAGREESGHRRASPPRAEC